MRGLAAEGRRVAAGPGRLHCMGGRATGLGMCIVQAAILVACDSPSEPPPLPTTSPAAPSEAPEPRSATTPYGRWTSDDVCLTLMHNGEVELSFRDAPPKVVVFGAGTDFQFLDRRFHHGERFHG